MSVSSQKSADRWLCCYSFSRIFGIRIPHGIAQNFESKILTLKGDINVTYMQDGPKICTKNVNAGREGLNKQISCRNVCMVLPD